jgi:copper transport protein
MTRRKGATRRSRSARREAPASQRRLAFPRHGFAFAAALLLAVVATLWAHSALKRSTPAAGARVPTPSALRLEFSERVELGGVVVALTDTAGRAAPLGPPAHPAATDDSASIVIVPVLGALGAGRYRVAWQIVGRDGHPVRGRFAFDVTGAAGAPPRQQRGSDSLSAHNPDSAAASTHAHEAAGTDGMPLEPAPADTVAVDAFDVESPAYVALRWLAYVTLLAGIGAVVMARITDRTATVGARHAVQTRIAGVGLGAAWLGVALTLARLLAQSWAIHGAHRALSPTLLGPLVGSVWGRAWALQLLGALAGVAGFTLALHDARRPGGWRIATLAAAIAAAGSALAGHAAAVEGWMRPVAVTADFLHVLAAGAWIGGAMMLALAVLRRADAPAAANVVRAFSPWALVGFATLAATGTIAAWLHLEHPLAPWASRYGRVLLLKLALIAIVLLLGLLNWRRLGPASSTGPGNSALRRSVWLEVLVALAVLAVTAVLVAVPPSE